MGAQGQNQGLAWSSDPSLWGNQVKKILQVLDRTKALHGPCMVLGPKPMGKPSKKKIIIIKKNIANFGQNQGLAWSSDSSLWGNQVKKKKREKNHKFYNCSDGESPRLKYCKMLRPVKVLG